MRIHQVHNWAVVFAMSIGVALIVGAAMSACHHPTPPVVTTTSISEPATDQSTTNPLDHVDDSAWEALVDRIRARNHLPLLTAPRRPLTLEDAHLLDQSILTPRQMLEREEREATQPLPP